MMLTATALGKQDVQVTLGVDTHADVHVVAALDQLGRLLGTHAAPTTPHALVITAPDALRSALRRQPLPRLVATAAAFGPACH